MSIMVYYYMDPVTTDTITMLYIKLSPAFLSAGLLYYNNIESSDTTAYHKDISP